MIRKLVAFTAFSIVGGAAVVNAQDTPTAPKDKIERRVQGTLLNSPFERSYLGVQTQEISKENFSKFGLSSVRGVGIEKVVENSPAAQAGLQNNDVIIRFDGEEVESILKLNRLISEVAPDHVAKLTVLRGGSEREINVTMGKRDSLPFQYGFRTENLQALPNIQVMPATPLLQGRVFPPAQGEGDRNVFVWRGGASRQIGVGVTALTNQLGGYFGITEGTGLLINNVRENSPAAKAGLKAGDIIVEADGKAVKGQTDLIRAINEKKEGDISLTIIRDRNRQTVRVTPEMSKDGAMNFEEFENLFETNPGQMNFRVQPPVPPTAPIPATPMKIAPRIL
jgi:membrane-associated protease RseP (regulator of RpoE activity)